MTIQIRRAREHNLKDVDVEFGDGLTVVTGISGSGKTSLVFDTLYHESRRRFLEIINLGSSALHLAPAKVGSITGLGPAVAVGQNLLNRNPASILATASGLHPFFRLMYANYAKRNCATCGQALSIYSEDEVILRLISMAHQGEVGVLAPLVHRSQGSHETLLRVLKEQFGRQAVFVDGRHLSDGEDGEKLDPTQWHDVDIEVDRLFVGVKDGTTLANAARQAFRQVVDLGVYALKLRNLQGEVIYPLAPVCPECGSWFSELRPTHFLMVCPSCSGEGSQAGTNDPEKQTCQVCHGSRMHPEAAAARWQGLCLPELLALSVSQAHRLFTADGLPVSARRLKFEIERRLDALETVGLGYINLDRPSPSLSRGEAQRVRLAVALTSRLEDLLHVLDEPTVGQHPADVARLMPVFRRLGGPVVFVEHDRLAASTADWAIDLGPGAGESGGRIIFQGSPAGLWQAETPTGQWFSLRQAGLPLAALPPAQQKLVVRQASLRNLRSIDVPVPIGRLTVVTGVSGSGKSTFVEDVLVASLKSGMPIGCLALEGPALKPFFVDQSPIGINPRSNPATYAGLADIIRDLFASASPFSPSYFSFNRQEGACPTCNGLGSIEVQMRYLPSSWITCANCEGKRFSEEVLSARLSFGAKSYNIAEFFELSIAEIEPLLTQDARLSQRDQRVARNILHALIDVGLSYLPIGQPSPSLSGGESQRVKLARCLGKGNLAGQLLVLDEPSTGLHPQDVAGLLKVFYRLRDSGATLLIVEHNTDIIRAADWVVDLGPGAGPEGGQLIYAGPPKGLLTMQTSLTGQALREEADLQPNASPQERPGTADHVIQVIGARTHNLRNVSVSIPKAALTVVTGVSGSGKSSLVGDVLESEARRRFLESLSMYERQSTREGPEAPVDEIRGLGVAIAVTTERLSFRRRATVGSATELMHHLAVLLADLGERNCPECGTAMERRMRGEITARWKCPNCRETAPLAEPRHFLPSVYAAACLKCNGIGTLPHPVPSKLIIHPEKPLCAGAMYSPGFFPQGYLGKPFNGGYDMVQALAWKYKFDPFTTPWNEMTPVAQQVFLFGDPEPLEVHYRSRKGREHTAVHHFPGFYGWIGDWDVGGTYSETRPCPECLGGGLRPQYAAITLAGKNVRSLNDMPLAELEEVLALVDKTTPAEGLTGTPHFAATSLAVARRRARFLCQVGLGYLHLNRPTATLSAGEAQRVRLAGLLGSELTSLTVLLDEPSRGLHPSEVNALLGALKELSRAGNTVVVVEHDLEIIKASDYLVDMGPGAGKAGGEVVAQGRPKAFLTDPLIAEKSLTAKWLKGERSGHNLAYEVMPYRHKQKGGELPTRWLEIRGACANNLRGEEVRFPLGCLTGVCGVSGSGKSTLVIDTLGRVLAPKHQTTSVAYEPIAPGEYEAIVGAPGRAIIVDQTRQGISNPADYLDLTTYLISLFARSESAVGLDLSEEQLGRRCSGCGGSGVLRTEMGFLPDIFTPCDLCAGSGFRPEAWEVKLKGLSLPEVFELTLDEVEKYVKETFAVEERLSNPLAAAQKIGLGYLVMRQPGLALSGGEVQRLKIARELCRKTLQETLYILDEPTVGQHVEDVARLVGVLRRLIDEGHSVLVVEHHPLLLACCDWLVELGPGGGPQGGWVIAAGTPENLANGKTPTAPYLKEILEAGQ